jgi:hypothetical protein
MVPVWFLNLDADEELAKPSGHKRPKDYEERRAERAAALLPLTSRRGGVLLEDWNNSGAEALGLCWMPTPKAEARLRSAGLKSPPCPHVEVLKRANSRKFSAALGVDLPGACYTENAEELDLLTVRACVGTDWLLKRPFGFAGRGRQKVGVGILKEAARAWALTSLREGHGVEIQPNVRRVADFALHGFVTRNKQVILGTPTRLVCDDRGQWMRSEPADPNELDSNEAKRMHTAADEAGAGLIGLGYYGPFGIDGFRWRDTDGKLHFCPRIEVNARYTMGWAIGMGDQMPDLDLR